MTEAQAHHFIERWERTSFPQRWRAKAEIEAGHRLEELFVGISIAAIAVASTSLDSWSVEVCTFSVFAFSVWMFLRVRKACRILGYSPLFFKKRKS